jgi:subtilisin family serine protease
MKAHAETLPTGVDRIGADSNAEGKVPNVSGVPVAIIDSGIDPNHPDLNVRGGHNCTSKKRGKWADDNGHGTHVAGIVGAKRNGKGVVGVAPGTPLYAVKVLNERGFGSASDIICGLEWTARQGITVANVSLGGSFPADDPTACDSSLYHQAYCNAAADGVRIVVSAGNTGRNAGNIVPAKYDQVITVSALLDTDGCAGGEGRLTNDGPDDSLALFSSRGEVVDVAAPGYNIVSTFPGGKYGKLSGTSMAAPHVAGAIARGWDPDTGEKEPGPDHDNDGVAEGIVRLSDNVACSA